MGRGEGLFGGVGGKTRGLPGEVSPCPAKRVPNWQQNGKQRQKSAEAIVGESTVTEGLNCKARMETGVSNGIEMQKQQQLEPPQQPGRKSEGRSGSHQVLMAAREPPIHEG